MFFPESIKSIKSGDRVLEVGPGASPYKRADIYLEKIYDNEAEEYAQKAYNKHETSKKNTVYYNGGIFPFADKEFDYVVCSHVIEHIPASELPLFMSELSRVAKRGYIEFPNVFYELVNFQPVHLWLMNYKNGEILFLDKEAFKSSRVHEIFREMVYGADTYLYKSFLRYKEAFFCGFEWSEEIRFRLVGGFDELVTDQDRNRIKKIFAFKPSFARRASVSLIQIKIRAGNFLKKAKAYAGGDKCLIHKTAILENRALITVGKGTEIKENVIIKTYDNPVTLGENVQLNPFTVIYGGSGVIVGNNVMIAPHCAIAAGNHDYKQKDLPMRFAPSISRGPIVIEDDVWIAANCTITDGVTIGRGAVVAANSVVNKNVEPFTVVGGVPARFISNRFERQVKND
ncbi:methyltransferase domain-containing protein [Candidatus Falkowbacteria bacterium]|nr:methyltransferase domain-containing protein [Candidatus Falkowbacteria bacterium]